MLDEESGLPIPGVRVRQQRVRSAEEPQSDDPGAFPWSRPQDIVTDAEGVFLIEGLSEGTYHLGASHRHYYFEGKAPEVTLPGGELELIEIRMKPGGQVVGTVRNLQFESEPGRGVTYRAELTLRRDREKPGGVSEVGEEKKESRRQPGPSHGLFVNRQGRFTGEGIKPGSCSVVLKKATYRQDAAQESRPTEEAIPLGELEIKPGETATVEFDVPR